MPINKEQVLESIKKLRDSSPKRKFTQSVDFSISLKDTDVKKQENKLKEVVVLPNPLGKKISVCALVDKELIEDAKKVFDEAILKDEFETFKKKRMIKNLVRKYKVFVAQANLMGEVAKYFGKFLGPKGRMPDPKAGGVIPPKKELLKPIYDKMQRTVSVAVKDQPNINVTVGVESLSDDQLADNILAVYNVVVSKLPRHEDQINHLYLKMTMSRSVSI